MGAATKFSELKTLAQFSPLDQLDHEKLKELVDKSTVQQFKAHETIKGPQSDTQSTIYFLLSGSLELTPQMGPVENIEAGSPRAARSICNQNSPGCQAIAKTETSILMVDAELLELLLSWKGPQQSYQVDEFVDSDGKEWMSGLLQNKSLLNLSTSQLQSLMGIIAPIDFLAGDTIITQGELDDCYYIISSGHCSVSRKAEPEGKDILLAELGPGDGFGEEAIIAQTARNATVTMKDDGLLLRLKQHDFSELLEKSLIKSVDYSQAAKLKQDGADTIDVRLPEDFAVDGIGINIPLATLRLKINSLDKTRPYVVCCNDGHQSAVATFLLNQQGLDAYALKGGLNSLSPADSASIGALEIEKQDDCFDKLQQEIDVFKKVEQENKTLLNTLLQKDQTLTEEHKHTMEPLAEPELTIIDATTTIEPLNVASATEQAGPPSSLQQQVDLYRNEVFRLEDLNTELLHTIQNLEKLTDPSKIEKQQKEFDNINPDKQKLTQDMQQLEQQLHTEKQLNQTHAQEIANQQNKINELTSQRDSLATSLSEISEKTLELETESSKQKDLFSTLQKEIKTYKEETQEYISDQEAIIDRLTKDLENSTQESNKKQEEIHTLKSTLEANTQSINKLTSQINKAELQEKQLRQTIIKLSKSSEELESINEGNQQTIEALETKLSQQEHINKLHQEEIDQQALEQISLHEVIEASSQQLLEEQTTQHNIRQDLTKTQNDLNAAQKLIEELQKKVFSLQNQVEHIETLEQEIDNKNTAISTREMQLKQQKIYVEQLVDEKDSIQEKFKSIQKEIDTFSNQRRYLQSLEQNVTQKEKQISQLQQAIKDQSSPTITTEELSQERQRSQAAIGLQNDLRREMKTLLNKLADAELRASNAEDALLIMKSEMGLSPTPSKAPTAFKTTHSDNDLIEMGRSALDNSNISSTSSSTREHSNATSNPFPSHFEYRKEEKEKSIFGKIVIAGIAVVGIYIGSTNYMGTAENSAERNNNSPTLNQQTESTPAQSPSLNKNNQPAVIQEESPAHKTREQRLLEQARNKFEQRSQ